MSNHCSLWLKKQTPNTRQRGRPIIKKTPQQIPRGKEILAAGPRCGPDATTDWPADRQSSAYRGGLE
jgi:hypothetical protein